MDAEPDALKEWKTNIFKIIDTDILFYSHKTNTLRWRPKSYFNYLKRGTHDFHTYVLFPADKATNNVVVVWR